MFFNFDMWINFIRDIMQTKDWERMQLTFSEKGQETHCRIATFFVGATQKLTTNAGGGRKPVAPVSIRD